MIEISKYTPRISRELPPGARQQSAYTEWTHEGSPNHARCACGTHATTASVPLHPVGADGFFPVKEDAYTANRAYAEAQVAFTLIPCG